jgi:Protein of unknown function (DUF1329)
VVFGAQTPELTDDRREVVDFPYYYPNATPATIGPYYLEQREMTVGPPENAGDAYVALQPINVARTRFDAWQYLPGQRRVRRAPSLSYDTRNPAPPAWRALTITTSSAAGWTTTATRCSASARCMCRTTTTGC